MIWSGRHLVHEPQLWFRLKKIDIVVHCWRQSPIFCITNSRWYRQLITIKTGSDCCYWLWVDCVALKLSLSCIFEYVFSCQSRTLNLKAVTTSCQSRFRVSYSVSSFLPTCFKRARTMFGQKPLENMYYLQSELSPQKNKLLCLFGPVSIQARNEGRSSSRIMFVTRNLLALTKREAEI